MSEHNTLTEVPMGLTVEPYAHMPGRGRTSHTVLRAALEDAVTKLDDDLYRARAYPAEGYSVEDVAEMERRKTAYHRALAHDLAAAATPHTVAGRTSQQQAAQQALRDNPAASLDEVVAAAGISRGYRNEDAFLWRMVARGYLRLAVD